MIRTITFFLLTFICSYAFSQGEANSLEGVPFKERIVTGGGFGLGFGNTQDYISVSPLIGYQVTKKLLTGLSFTYRYTNFKIVKPSLALNDYGLNPFVRFTVYQNIFLQGEYEYLNYEFPITYTETTRRSFDSVLGGGGFIQPISDKVSFYVIALYNFSYKDPTSQNVYSVYNSPLVLRAGINIGKFVL